MLLTNGKTQAPWPKRNTGGVDRDDDGGPNESAAEIFCTRARQTSHKGRTQRAAIRRGRRRPRDIVCRGDGQPEVTEGPTFRTFRTIKAGQSAENEKKKKIH